MSDVMNQKLRIYWPDSHHYQLGEIEKAGWVTVGDVLNQVVSAADMLRIPRVGVRTLTIARHAVARAVLEWSL